MANKDAKHALFEFIGLLWKGVVNQFKSGDESFKSLLVFLSRKYPSKKHDTHLITSDNIVYATYNQELLKRIGNKLLHISRSLGNITPEQKSQTLSDFEYVDYSITMEINGKPKVFNTLQYLANMVAYELGGNESYVIQPFLAIQNNKLVPILTTDQIHAMIEGKVGFVESWIKWFGNATTYVDRRVSEVVVAHKQAAAAATKPSPKKASPKTKSRTVFGALRKTLDNMHGHDSSSSS
jgi:hypothetical protein